ncbi:MAG: type I restriction enzyme HsdR N-terminal domain-containing protein [Bacteroidales bacterium]|nr:type I restriction enzyme HsdR N-terminal domain-containing protein [Bacteroidales bacterium]
MAEERVWDPLRRKEVALTPEERVRQWFITVLRDELAVPPYEMMSEATLSYGGKTWRADIVVYRRNMSPAMVVECKRPDVELTREVLEQALRYNLVLDVNWIVITNGKKTLVFARDLNSFTRMDHLPDYGEICR